MGRGPDPSSASGIPAQQRPPDSQSLSTLICKMGGKILARSCCEER